MCGSVRVGQSGLAAAVTYLPLAPIPVRLIGIPGPWSNPGSCHSILGNSMPVSPICSNPSCIINVNFLTFPAAFRISVLRQWTRRATAERFSALSTTRKNYVLCTALLLSGLALVILFALSSANGKCETVVTQASSRAIILRSCK